MRRVFVDPGAPQRDAIEEAAKWILNGGIVALPTDTLYGLAADPFSAAAVARVFDVKGRAAERALPLIAAGTAQVETHLGTLGEVAARLADRWLRFHSPVSWTNLGLTEFDRQVHAWSVIPAGTEGYAKAEVTAGGVDTDELSAKTMESLKVPGLFFIGEVVDVTGQLGGFNFQWAWSSGAAAGRLPNS